MITDLGAYAQAHITAQEQIIRGVEEARLRKLAEMQALTDLHLAPFGVEIATRQQMIAIWRTLIEETAHGLQPDVQPQPGE